MNINTAKVPCRLCQNSIVVAYFQKHIKEAHGITYMEYLEQICNHEGELWQNEVQEETKKKKSKK